MLSLSGVPDRVVSWSDFPRQRNSQETKQDLSYNFFKLLQVSHFNYMLVLCGC